MGTIPHARQLSFDSPKLCECGCGQPAPIAKQDYKSQGILKGQPRRFVHGHQNQQALLPRFWSKVDKAADADACWEWRAYRCSDGYGVFNIRGRGTLRAHRLAYELTYGPIPDGMAVLHRCDNPPCCNPAHLRLGTQLDNIADRHMKGRSGAPRGEAHGEHKYSENTIRHAKALFRAGWTRREISNYLRINYATLKGVLNGRSWKHIE